MPSKEFIQPNICLLEGAQSSKSLLIQIRGNEPPEPHSMAPLTHFHSKVLHCYLTLYQILLLLFLYYYLFLYSRHEIK